METKRKYYSVNKERNEYLKRIQSVRSSSSSNNSSSLSDKQERTRHYSEDNADYLPNYSDFAQNNLFKRGKLSQNSSQNLFSNNKGQNLRTIAEKPSMDWKKFLKDDHNPFLKDDSDDYVPE